MYPLFLKYSEIQLHKKNKAYHQGFLSKCDQMCSNVNNGNNQDIIQPIQLVTATDLLTN